jgi:hypothetical protein
MNPFTHPSGLLPVERVGQGGRLGDRRPGPAHIRGQAERRLVEEDQAGSASLGVCLIAGQRFVLLQAAADVPQVGAVARVARSDGRELAPLVDLMGVHAVDSDPRSDAS